jgi:hypothetical protein
MSGRTHWYSARTVDDHHFAGGTSRCRSRSIGRLERPLTHASRSLHSGSGGFPTYDRGPLVARHHMPRSHRPVPPPVNSCTM